jgi:ketosteroid isomerase-like protein
MSDENLELVYRGVDAMNRRDLDEILDLVTDDFEWFAAFTGGGPLEGPVYRGKGDLTRYLGQMAITWSELEFEIESLRDHGDRVLVLANVHAVGRGSGVRLEQQFAAVYEIRDGKIARGWNCRDLAEAQHAAGLEK